MGTDPTGNSRIKRLPTPSLSPCQSLSNVFNRQLVISKTKGPGLVEKSRDPSLCSPLFFFSSFCSFSFSWQCDKRFMGQSLWTAFPPSRPTSCPEKLIEMSSPRQEKSPLGYAHVVTHSGVGIPQARQIRRHGPTRKAWRTATERSGEGPGAPPGCVSRDHEGRHCSLGKTNDDGRSASATGRNHTQDWSFP
ncbi:hypothetical protein BDV38DRAFT_18767 [Aspergillus pseudotamarii]|uniref:Uncharacterized protein n=1 Tax=Aspergillus pseudotamarii TaxID=132259 RepID=A0A5N6T2G5_ASPPS|nr:uncharacterized protein BDV38DRAFT_18767 [Aspergillus pseudotamarii]KAE8140496.1 hypothetical protein BDV38DRAFT_18767 [Aspergillus pseudotamarii]